MGEETDAEVRAHEPPPYEETNRDELWREVMARREAGEELDVHSDAHKDEIIAALEQNDAERSDAVFENGSEEAGVEAADEGQTDPLGVDGPVPDAPSGDELIEDDEDVDLEDDDDEVDLEDDDEVEDDESEPQASRTDPFGRAGAVPDAVPDASS